MMASKCNEKTTIYNNCNNEEIIANDNINNQTMSENKLDSSLTDKLINKDVTKTQESDTTKKYLSLINNLTLAMDCAKLNKQKRKLCDIEPIADNEVSATKDNNNDNLNPKFDPKQPNAKLNNNSATSLPIYLPKKKKCLSNRNAKAINAQTKAAKSIALSCTSAPRINFINDAHRYTKYDNSQVNTSDNIEQIISTIEQTEPSVKQIEPIVKQSEAIIKQTVPTVKQTKMKDQKNSDCDFDSKYYNIARPYAYSNFSLSVGNKAIFWIVGYPTNGTITKIYPSTKVNIEFNQFDGNQSYRSDLLSAITPRDGVYVIGGTIAFTKTLPMVTAETTNTELLALGFSVVPCDAKQNIVNILTNPGSDKPFIIESEYNNKTPLSHHNPQRSAYYNPFDYVINAPNVDLQTKTVSLTTDIPRKRCDQFIAGHIVHIQQYNNVNQYSSSECKKDNNNDNCSTNNTDSCHEIITTNTLQNTTGLKAKSYMFEKTISLNAGDKIYLSMQLMDSTMPVSINLQHNMCSMDIRELVAKI